jgi:hypothetical protein
MFGRIFGLDGRESYRELRLTQPVHNREPAIMQSVFNVE